MRRIDLVFLVVMLVFISSSSARMGYDISARVGGSGFEVHRSTAYMDVSYMSSVSGSGNFSKYSKIDGFAGLETKETTSTPYTSNLSYKEQMRLRSLEGPVSVRIKLKSGKSNESLNESEIKITESGSLEVDERWTTYFADYKEVTYTGRGLESREAYSNNGDIVKTSIHSWKLEKSSYYTSSINRSLIKADIRESGYNYSRLMNRTSDYKLALETIGTLVHIEALKQGLRAQDLSYISEDYLGHQRMNLKIQMRDYLPPVPEVPEFLECCFGGDIEGGSDSWRPPQWDGSMASSDRIFSAEP